MKIGNGLEEWLNISIGTKRGDPASPSQFIAYLGRMMDGIRNNGTAVNFKGNESNLRFADNIDLIENSWKALQESVRLPCRQSR